MSTVKANDLTNVTGGIPTVKSQQLIPTAWVNFNGIGTLAIRDSEGVSSVTDSAVGNYLVNFAITMANSSYCAIASTERTSTWADGGVNVINYTTTRVHLQNVENTAAVDTAIFSVAVMGGQS
mgnify:CR=1 FL=1